MLFLFKNRFLICDYKRGKKGKNNTVPFPSTHQPASARSRSRSNIAQEGEAEASSQESLQELVPEEVLVISLGTGPQTVPGMMSENEVM